MSLNIQINNPFWSMYLILPENIYFREENNHMHSYILPSPLTLLTLTLIQDVDV